MAWSRTLAGELAVMLHDGSVHILTIPTEALSVGLPAATSNTTSAPWVADGDTTGMNHNVIESEVNLPHTSVAHAVIVLSC